MPSSLLIRLPAAPGPLEWLAFDERGRAGAVARGRAPAPAELTRARRVVVLVPSEDCVLLSANVPARSREQWLKALPFALEDQLAEPVEQLQFGVGPRADGPVIVARRARVAAWLDALARLGIAPDALLPDVLGLDAGDSGTLLLEPGRALARLGPSLGFASEPALLPALLARAPAETVAGLRVLRARAADAPAFPRAEVVEPLLALGSAVDATLPNLLVGAFAPRHRGAPVRRLWRIAAGLAAALLVLAFGFALLERAVLERRAAALRAEMTAIYRQVYPDGRVDGVDLAGRMRAEFGRERSGVGGALAVLGRVAPALAADARVLLTGIDYRAGVLELAVLGPDVGALDALRARLASIPGLGVELAAASTNERGAEGRLRVVGGAP